MEGWNGVVCPVDRAIKVGFFARILTIRYEGTIRGDQSIAWLGVSGRFNVSSDRCAFHSRLFIFNRAVSDGVTVSA